MMTPLRSPTDLVALLKARRQELGDTQTQFGKRIGRTQAWVSEFERGASRNIYVTTMLEVLAAAGLTLEIGFATHAPVPVPTASPGPDDTGDFATGFEDDDETTGYTP